MFLPKIREIKEALYSFFTPAYTTKFPAAAYTAEKDYRGKPRYNDEYCTGCGTCALVCPADAISVSVDLQVRKKILQVDYRSCINCGQCEEHCITRLGIKCTNEFSFATLDKNEEKNFEVIEKEIALCEVCGGMIAPRHHLKYVMEKLGAKAFAHPNFLIENQKEFIDLPDSKVKSRIRREDQIKQVCPKCRHKIVVEDEFYTVH